MSIADLFVPNPYPINVGSVVAGAITCTTLDASGAVTSASLDTGPLTSTGIATGNLNAVDITVNSVTTPAASISPGGDINAATVTAGALTSTGGVFCTALDTGGGVLIAGDITGNSLTLPLTTITAIGDITSASIAVNVGNFGACTATFMAAGAAMTFPSASTPLSIADSAAEVTASQDYSGAIVVVGAGVLRYRKFGQWVNLSFTQVTAPDFATATDVITLSTVLPAGISPVVDQGVACGVRSNATSILGLFRITAGGVMTFSPINGNFVAPFLCGMTGGVSIYYPTV